MTTIQCPRCSKPCTTRLRHLKGVAGGVGIGVVILLTLPFLKHTYCPDHGQVPMTEFSETDQTRMRQRTTIQLAVTVVFLAIAIGLVVFALQP